MRRRNVYPHVGVCGGMWVYSGWVLVVDDLESRSAVQLRLTKSQLRKQIAHVIEMCEGRRKVARTANNDGSNSTTKFNAFDAILICKTTGTADLVISTGTADFTVCQTTFWHMKFGQIKSNLEVTNF